MLTLLGIVHPPAVDTAYLITWVERMVSQQNLLRSVLEQTKIGSFTEEQQCAKILETLGVLRVWNIVFQVTVFPLLRALFSKWKLQIDSLQTAQEEKFWEFYPKFLEVSRIRAAKHTLNEACYLRECYLSDVSEKASWSTKIKDSASSTPFQNINSQTLCFFVSGQFKYLSSAHYRLEVDTAFSKLFSDTLHNKISYVGTLLKGWLLHMENSPFKTVLHKQSFVTFSEQKTQSHLKKDLKLFSHKAADLVILAVFEASSSLCLLVKTSSDRYQLLRVDEGIIKNTVIFPPQSVPALRRASTLQFSGTKLLASEEENQTFKRIAVFECAKLFDAGKSKSELHPNDSLLQLHSIHEYGYTSEYFVYTNTDGIHFTYFKRAPDGNFVKYKIDWEALPEDKVLPIAKTKDIQSLRNRAKKVAKTSRLAANSAEQAVTKMVCCSSPNQLVFVTLTKSAVKRLVYFQVNPKELKPSLLDSKHLNLTLPGATSDSPQLSCILCKGQFYVTAHNNTRSMTFTLHRGKIQLVRVNDKRISWTTAHLHNEKSIAMSSVTQPPCYSSGIILGNCTITGKIILQRLIYHY